MTITPEHALYRAVVALASYVLTDSNKTPRHLAREILIRLGEPIEKHYQQRGEPAASLKQRKRAALNGHGGLNILGLTDES